MDTESPPSKADDGASLPAPAGGASLWPVEECSICCEAVGGAIPVRRLACGHGFHHECIARWLQRKAQCPLCKADTPAPAGGQTTLPFRIDLGHQEMSRVIQELEAIFRAVHGVAGHERGVPASGLVMNLCESLGYEDEDELEEALGGPLVDFLSALPHFEVLWDDQPNATTTTASESLEALRESADSTEEAASAQRADGVLMPLVDGAAVRPDPRILMHPEEEPSEAGGEGKQLVFTVSEPKDLWRVVLQGSNAVVEIPELEFQIKPHTTRRVDTIYNMIAAAIFHLSNHVRTAARSTGNLSEDSEKIVDAINSLNAILDLEQSFTFTVLDPDGISTLKPTEGVHIQPYSI